MEYETYQICQLKQPVSLFILLVRNFIVRQFVCAITQLHKTVCNGKYSGGMRPHQGGGGGEKRAFSKNREETSFFRENGSYSVYLKILGKQSKKPIFLKDARFFTEQGRIEMIQETAKNREIQILILYFPVFCASSTVSILPCFYCKK